MGAEPGVGKAEVPRLRVSAVIVLSNCLLAVGLLRAERLSSSCVACSLSCVVGVVLSLAHSWGGCGTAAVRCPTSSNQDSGLTSTKSVDALYSIHNGDDTKGLPANQVHMAFLLQAENEPGTRP